MLFLKFMSTFLNIILIVNIFFNFKKKIKKTFKSLEYNTPKL